MEEKSASWCEEAEGDGPYLESPERVEGVEEVERVDDPPSVLVDREGGPGVVLVYECVPCSIEKSGGGQLCRGGKEFGYDGDLEELEGTQKTELSFLLRRRCSLLH